MKDHSVTTQTESAIVPGILRTLYRLEWLWDSLAAMALFMVMVSLVVDALGRYLFNSPLPWAHDLMSRLLLPAAFFFALSSTLRLNLHVNIDVVYSKLARRVQNALSSINCLLAVGLFVVIGALGARTAYNAYEAGERMSGAIEWPAWIYAAFIPLGLFPVVIRLMLRSRETALRSWAGAKAPDWEPGRDGGAGEP